MDDDRVATQGDYVYSDQGERLEYVGHEHGESRAEHSYATQWVEPGSSRYGWEHANFANAVEADYEPGPSYEESFQQGLSHNFDRRSSQTPATIVHSGLVEHNVEGHYDPLDRGDPNLQHFYEYDRQAVLTDSRFRHDEDNGGDSSDSAAAAEGLNNPQWPDVADPPEFEGHSQDGHASDQVGADELPPGRIVCPRCPKIIREVDLRGHMRQVHPPRVYTCPLANCDKTFNTPSLLRRHMNTTKKHQCKVFKCRENSCSLVISGRMDNFRRHYDVRHPGATYPDGFDENDEE